MSWNCAAIDHGVTFYQNGKIAPCCFIDYNYRKDISELGNDPFFDLRKEDDVPPPQCNNCTNLEKH